MSRLVDLLAGRVEPGVFAWSGDRTEPDLEAAVEGPGWLFVLLDTSSAGNKRAFLAECRQTFGFPDWVGGNFDALADALSDVRAAAPGGVLVMWRGWRRLAQEHPHAFSMALSVFAGRAAFRVGGRFAVLLEASDTDDLALPRLGDDGS